MAIADMGWSDIIFAQPENLRSRVQELGTYLLHKSSYSQFSIQKPKFSLPRQQGRSEA